MAIYASGVEQTHPLYDKFRFAVRTVRDACEGESAIKRADTVYLPMPTAMIDADDGPSVSFYGGYRVMSMSDEPNSTNDYFREYDPSYHPNPAYSAYKKRAHFPLITGNVANGLHGIATDKPSMIEIPSAIEYIYDDATRNGMNLEALYKAVLEQSIKVGRSFLLADIDERTDTIYGSLYKWESIINWKEETIDGRRKVKFVVLRELIDKADADDFSHDKIYRYRVLRLNELGKYQVDIYVQSEYQYSVIPNFRGKTLDYIPGVVIGSSNFDLYPDEIPLYGVARCAVQIYMKRADLSQAEFLSCNPTLFVSGVDKNDLPGVVGSGVLVGLPNPEAKAYYTKTDTAGLAQIHKSIEALFEEAYAYGMMLLGGKKVAESAEAMRLRQAVSGANLARIVDTAGCGMKVFLQIVADWQTGKTDGVEYLPNKSFSNVVLTAAEMQALLQAWMGGGISWNSYQENMRRAGYVDASKTLEQEKKDIDDHPPPAPEAEGPEGVGNNSAVKALPTSNPVDKVGSSRERNGGGSE